MNIFENLEKRFVAAEGVIDIMDYDLKSETASLKFLHLASRPDLPQTESAAFQFDVM